MQKLDANIYYPFKFSEKQRVRRFIPSWSPYAIGLLIIFVAIAFVCVVNPCQNYFKELFSMFYRNHYYSHYGYCYKNLRLLFFWRNLLIDNCCNVLAGNFVLCTSTNIKGMQIFRQIDCYKNFQDWLQLSIIKT